MISVVAEVSHMQRNLDSVFFPNKSAADPSLRRRMPHSVTRRASKWFRVTLMTASVDVAWKCKRVHRGIFVQDFCSLKIFVCTQDIALHSPMDAENFYFTFALNNPFCYGRVQFDERAKCKLFST